MLLQLFRWRIFLVASALTLSGCAHDASLPHRDNRAYGDGEKVKKEATQDAPYSSALARPGIQDSNAKADVNASRFYRGSDQQSSFIGHFPQNTPQRAQLRARVTPIKPNPTQVRKRNTEPFLFGLPASRPPGTKVNDIVRSRKIRALSAAARR